MTSRNVQNQISAPVHVAQEYENQKDRPQGPGGWWWVEEPRAAMFQRSLLPPRGRARNARQCQHTAPDRHCACLCPLHKSTPTVCSGHKGSHSLEERARQGHRHNTGHNQPHEGRSHTALDTDHLLGTFHRDEGGGRGALNAKPRDFTRWSRHGRASGGV